MFARLALCKIFERIGARSCDTALRVEFSDGSVYQNGPDQQRREVSVTFRSRWAEWRVLLFFYEGLFEGFIGGDVDLAGDQPIATLAKLGHSARLDSDKSWTRLAQNPLIWLREWTQEWRQDGGGHAQAVLNADFHYALPPALFEAMLGGTLGYSEGLWTPETKTLDQAKFNGYEYICRKLRLGLHGDLHGEEIRRRRHRL
jgi:hypothetical protein